MPTPWKSGRTTVRCSRQTPVWPTRGMVLVKATGTSFQVATQQRAAVHPAGQIVMTPEQLSFMSALTFSRRRLYFFVGQPHRAEGQTASVPGPRLAGLDFNFNRHRVNHWGYRVHHRTAQPVLRRLGHASVALDHDFIVDNQHGEGAGQSARRSHKRARASLRPSAPVP